MAESERGGVVSRGGRKVSTQRTGLNPSRTYLAPTRASGVVPILDRSQSILKLYRVGGGRRGRIKTSNNVEMTFQRITPRPHIT
ncbi:hypothetical protein BgiBS90_004785, partial [Biomphalaria glabrata]